MNEMLEVRCWQKEEGGKKKKRNAARGGISGFEVRWIGRKLDDKLINILQKGNKISYLCTFTLYSWDYELNM